MSTGARWRTMPEAHLRSHLKLVLRPLRACFPSVNNTEIIRRNAHMVVRRLPLLFAFVAVTLAFVQVPASARHNFSILEVARQEVAAGDIVR